MESTSFRQKKYFHYPEGLKISHSHLLKEGHAHLPVDAHLRNALPRFARACRQSADALAALAPRLFRDRRGNFAMFTAILLPFLMIAVGSAVDLSRAITAKKDLQDSLDAAALAAIQENKASDIKKSLRKFFEANRQQYYGKSIARAKFVSFDGSRLVVEGTLSLPTTFAKFFNISDIPISTTSVAVKPAYDDIYFSIDLSSSTGVGATPEDRASLGKLTRPEMGAVFGNSLAQGGEVGCHRRHGWEPPGKTVSDGTRRRDQAPGTSSSCSSTSWSIFCLIRPIRRPRAVARITVVGFSSLSKELVSLHLRVEGEVGSRQLPGL